MPTRPSPSSADAHDRHEERHPGQATGHATGLATGSPGGPPISPLIPVGPHTATGPDAVIDPNQDLGWFRRLWPLVMVQRKWIAIAVITSILSIVSQVGVPEMVRRAIDAVGPDGPGRDDLDTALVGLVVLGVIRFVSNGASRYVIFRIAHRVDLLLRHQIYEKMTTLSWSFFDRTQSGQIISRANADIRSMQLYLAFVPLLATSMTVFAFALVVMLRIHVPLTLVAILPLPCVYLLGSRFRNLVFPLTWITQARAAEVATIVDENINGTRVVKSFAAEQRQIEDLAMAAHRLRWSSVETIRTRGRYNPVIEGFPRLGMALVLLYGGWLAIDGEVTIGALFQFNAYVLMLAAPFRLIGFVLLQAQRAGSSAQRVYEILDEEPDVVDRPGAVEPTSTTGEISFDGVDFRYTTTAGAPLVLDGFTLRIGAGESVAIVGRTGCGKSTVARLLARFYDVQSGTVAIDGTDVRDLTLAAVRHHVGIVADEPFLFSASLHDNIAFARPDASRAEVIAAASAAQAHEFIGQLADGYDTVVGERGYTLSGGQRQRIALARVLLHDPGILVLDDATSAIDVGVEARIHDALGSLTADRTTIVIAHRLSTISLADRVVLMVDGRIVADGTHEQLLATEPRYIEVLANANADTKANADAKANNDAKANANANANKDASANTETVDGAASAAAEEEGPRPFAQATAETGTAADSEVPEPEDGDADRDGDRT